VGNFAPCNAAFTSVRLLLKFTSCQNGWTDQHELFEERYARRMLHGV